MSQLQYLHESLDRRYRPEDVADSILQILDDQLVKSERRLLQRAAKGSLRQRVLKYTSMLQDFARPVGLQQQIATAVNLFDTAYSMTEEDCQDPYKVETFLRHINKEILKTFGNNDFMYNRMNREARRLSGLTISRRRYNKLFRHLARTENKLITYLNEVKKRNLTQIGKSGLAHKLSGEEFSTDTNTACFVAYYTARSNLRSQFTIYGQQRAYDEIADMLFKRCKQSDTTNWWIIAHVYPNEDVLNQLDDQQKGFLVGRWFSILEEISAILADVWQKSNINRETMVVRRGNDSSTWNNMANAWNKARDHWMALIYSLGLDDILHTMCFGKVLRLIAGDVAAWHRRAGGGLDLNTYVWRELPLPWEVITKNATCTLSLVANVCERRGLDPEKSGWIAPRPRNKIEKYRPTPELVHGISVESPILASAMRRAGFFSGKSLKHSPRSIDVERHSQVLSEHHTRLMSDNNEDN